MEKHSTSPSARRSNREKGEHSASDGSSVTPRATRCCVASDESHEATNTSGPCVETDPPREKKSFAERVRRRLRLISAFYLHCREYKWGRRRSRTIALSSALYLLPALALFPVCTWEAWLWILTAIFSFNADYTFAGMRDNLWICGVHMADRYFASAMLGLQIFYNIPLWFRKAISIGAIGLGLTLACCVFKLLGMRTKVFRHHVIYHTLWHVIGSVGRVLVAVLEYPELLTMWY
ncbi:conserved hypothetical protein [Neospora caninum Liverpool]|uniref:Transmembrane protein n=1 Tax=Neospora caninum (strain Liverpool) TaxID=572307 RepID=F0VR89_NEOCL|nr:conserved hypothetical protein [Neospora caninum Liverpool]CBZ56237.1 conserved hypothetical protein [Neospora caninum Liverpool]CEL70999.1 TPA: hypothetical protein BN1204_066620 [Neospora caninum Liverpool]|eukprot:XP_003886262.1 conserved hypothetical protein [Neospora caninum Liverpool]